MSGPAIIHLHRGTFVAATAEVSAGVVTFRGRLRVRDLTGTRLYPVLERSHKLRAGEFVEWVETEAEAVAA
jgi:hypothetical protein